MSKKINIRDIEIFNLPFLSFKFYFQFIQSVFFLQECLNNEFCYAEMEKLYLFCIFLE